jgi:hypothetical protein
MFICYLVSITQVTHHHYHQPINIPTAGAQAFLMNYGLHIRRTGHNPPRVPSAGLWVLSIANAAGTNGLTCRPKHRGSRDYKFLVTHPMTDQRCICISLHVHKFHVIVGVVVIFLSWWIVLVNRCLNWFLIFWIASENIQWKINFMKLFMTT